MKNRSINLIADEIRATLKREVADVIKIGGLLAEAKAQLDHGEWLSWLDKEFSLTDRSARNYITAHAFAKSETISDLFGKSEIISDLKLRVSALYLLASGSLTLEEQQAVLKEAKTRWVGATRARQIVQDLQPPAEPEPESSAEPEPEPPAEPETEPEPAAEPPVPQPARSALEAYLTKEFSTAVNILMKLITKPSSKFIGVAQSSDLQMLANFLNGIAAAQSKPIIPGLAADHESARLQ